MIIRLIRNNLVVPVMCSALLIAAPSLSLASKSQGPKGPAASHTRTLLTDPKQRDQYLKTHENARVADDKAIDIVGSQNKEEVYDIAADIMDDMLKKSNGDPQALEKMMQEAQSNPEVFYQALSPAQKARIQEIADKVNAQKNAGH